MKSPAGAESPASKKKLLIIVFVIIGVLLVLLSAGIGIWKLYYADGGEEAATYQLPDFVYSPTAPADADRAYLGAIEHSEELSHIPCYCGCGQSAGHESVLDCFIASRDDDNIAFDRHGAT